MARLFWSADSGAANQSLGLLNDAGQLPSRSSAVAVDPSDVVYPAPGGGLLRVPVGGGGAAPINGTLNGQLWAYDANAGLWLPTPTAPVADGDVPSWDSASNTFVFSQPGAASSLQYFDTTHNPVGLWNFNNTLADTSGNGNNLTLAAGNAGFADVVPGKKGLFVWIGCRYQTAAAVPLLSIPGDVTLECILQQDSNPISNNQSLISYGGPTEVQADNTQYTFNIQATGAFTNTRNIGFDSETGAGVNNSYTSAGTSASLGCIHNILFLAVTRISNVIQFYVNGLPFANASAAFPAPNGGDGPNCRLVVGAGAGATAQDQILIFGCKVIASGLSAAQIKAEYNRTMGPAFGRLP